MNQWEAAIKTLRCNWRALKEAELHQKKYNLQAGQPAQESSYFFYNLFNKLLSSFWEVPLVNSLWAWEGKPQETEPFADQCIRQTHKRTTWGTAWGTVKYFISSKTWSFQHRTIWIGRTLRRLLKYVCTETAGYGTAYLIQKKKI